MIATAPSLDQVVYRAAAVVCDPGPHADPIDRVAADRPYYSGKHKRHGVNIQVLADRKGRLLWASPALPGAVHDVKAARTHGLPAAPAKFGLACLADNAYRGAGPVIAVPFRRTPRPLSNAQRQVNAAHTEPRTRRTRDGHPQSLKTVDQAALQPTPSHRGHRRHPRASNHRTPAEMKLE